MRNARISSIEAPAMPAASFAAASASTLGTEGARSVAALNDERVRLLLAGAGRLARFLVRRCS